MAKVEMSTEQMKQTLYGIKLRREMLERFNPNMKLDAIDQIIDLEQELVLILSGVPA
jgi:hypothetical protein